ncbi:MAG TPA: methyltransferase domain-containing protein [Actinomycetes bacterium]
MTTTAPASADGSKAQQRTGWGRQARQWYAQLEVIERQWGALSEGLLELARVTTGDRVLDLASGVGDPALTAAARVGPTGTVIATDLSPDMLAFAAQRATAAGLDNVQVHEMDAEAIDLPDASVDVVLCRLGLMFLPDLDRALAGVRRVLVPGGRFAAAIPWRPEGQALPRLVGALLGALGLPQPPPAAPGRPGIFSLADASVVCAGLERAGMAEVRVVPYTVIHDWRSPDEWIDFVLALNVPLRQQLAGVPEERVRAARHAATELAAEYVEADGHARFPGHGYYATATRPAG